jgi:DNA polymerase I-like protein with 3'-5' exonuclease and polymerase domains
MLRLACCLILRRDVKLLAPIHDAVLIEAAEAEIDHAVWHTREAMREASEHVLDGFEVQTDVEIVRYPERLGGGRMWELVKEKLSEKGRCNGYF